MMGTLVSYATIRQFNSLIIYGYNKNNSTRLDVFINNEGYFSDIPLPAKELIHLCISFSVPRGHVNIYIGGVLNRTLANFTNRIPIEAGGVFIVGQEQDGLASGYNKNQAFIGSITNFMMWGRELQKKEIANMASSKCACAKDYIISLKSEEITLHGGVGALPTAKCSTTK